MKSQDQRARMGAWRGNVYGRAEQILFVIRLRFPLSSLRHDLHQKKKGLHLPRNLILLHFLLFLLDQILFFFLGSGSFLLSTRHFSNVSSLFSTTDDEGMSARTTQHAPRTTHHAPRTRNSLFACHSYFDALLSKVVARETLTSERLQAVAPVTVNVTDVNDNNPRCSQAVYKTTVAENNPTNTFVLQVRA